MFYPPDFFPDSLSLRHCLESEPKGYLSLTKPRSPPKPNLFANFTFIHQAVDLPVTADLSKEKLQEVKQHIFNPLFAFCKLYPHQD